MPPVTCGASPNGKKSIVAGKVAPAFSAVVIVDEPASGAPPQRIKLFVSIVWLNSGVGHPAAALTHVIFHPGLPVVLLRVIRTRVFRATASARARCNALRRLSALLLTSIARTQPIAEGTPTASTIDKTVRVINNSINEKPE